MALNRTFFALTPERLYTMIMSARRRVVYAAPGLSPRVADALINAFERLCAEAVSVVVDVSEGVLRIGYGDAEALRMLREKGFPIRHAAGLRVSFVIVDEEGFIFALAPLLVEENSRDDDSPNAVRLSSGQIEDLVRAVIQQPRR